MNDVQIINETANDALHALDNGDHQAVEAALEEIRDMTGGINR